MSLVIQQFNERYTMATWVLGADEAGKPVASSQFENKTVHVFGSFSTAAVSIEGSMDGDSWVTLHSTRTDTDSHVELSGISESMIEGVLENPRFIRPVVSDSGTPEITIMLGASTR